MSERRTLQTRGEVIEEYSRDFPAEIVETYSRPLPGAVEPVPTEPTPRSRRKKRRVWKGLLILLAIAAVIALLAAGVRWLIWELQMPDDWGEDDYYYYDQDQEDEDAPITIPTVEPDADARLELAKDRGRALSAQEVYRKVSGAVVTVAVDLDGGRMSVGTGVIFREDGYILTNYHVVEGSNSITVTTYDGTGYDATLIGYDKSNDIAVLKIDATDLTPVVLGDSDTLNIGDSVVAIGNPLGELTFSLTTGVVSALDRPVTLSTGTTMNLIQTDCAINSGNSGGALFNLYGEVIGITNAKYSSSGSSSEASIDNIGFAIPIDQVRSIFESIITNGYIVKPYIGVTVSDVSSESQSYGLPQGAAVRSVTENGPAAEAGLQENDIITAVNGETITGSNDLVKLVKASAAGDTLELTVYRQGQTTTLTLTVGEQKTDALPAQTTDQNQQSQQGYYDGGQSGQSDNQFGGSWPFGFGFGG